MVDVLKGAGAAAAKQTFHRFLSSISHRPAGSPKATYIYTTGLWYMSRGHGGLDKWSDERQPPSDYNQAVQWRGEIENAVLQGKCDSVCALDKWIPDLCHPDKDVTGRRLKLTRPEKSVHGIVIRPPIMYGRSQSFVATYILDAAYQAGQKGEAFETFVNAESRWQTCHQDDVGDLFARIGERVSQSPIIAWSSSHGHGGHSVYLLERFR